MKKLSFDSEQLRSLIQDAVRIGISEISGQSQQPETNNLLTVQGAADFLSLSVATIYILISKGELPVMKRSKRCYFLKEDLINYLKKGRKKTNNEINENAERYVAKKKLLTSKSMKKQVEDNYSNFQTDSNIQ